MIAKFFRSYSVSYLRQKTTFVIIVLMWRGCGARGIPETAGGLVISCLDNGSAGRLRLPGTGRTR
jgi:hypothetical protein